jgi:hypothetical protein
VLKPIEPQLMASLVCFRLLKLQFEVFKIFQKYSLEQFCTRRRLLRPRHAKFPVIVALKDQAIQPVSKGVTTVLFLAGEGKRGPEREWAILPDQCACDWQQAGGRFYYAFWELSSTKSQLYQGNVCLRCWKFHHGRESGWDYGA